MVQIRFFQNKIEWCGKAIAGCCPPYGNFVLLICKENAVKNVNKV
jgi:hypothetical protein